MAGRREMMARDRRRNSPTRKATHREHLARQQQQAEVLRRLWERARAREEARERE